LEHLPIGSDGFQTHKQRLLSHLLYQAQELSFVRAARDTKIGQTFYLGIVTFGIVTISKQ
jgi:hypothetical protein